MMCHTTEVQLGKGIRLSIGIAGVATGPPQTEQNHGGMADLVSLAYLLVQVIRGSKTYHMGLKKRILAGLV